MRLESIALHGFKSFGEKTVVRVLPGITGIVGPNGCGKSNISEAVRWALGEQSAKSLRGQLMEDLIFHGSQSRKPVGLAEVELTFRNDGTLSVPWAEVSVGRRLYRTGESEYLLNNSATRLRDILDLFAGTGANPRAYSVIDQDKLNHVLTAKPHDQVGLAEVELTFRNDGTLSVPWAEVSVGRRLYRTGESEYLLNNSATRLRDILDLFAGTGANPRAYSVIDQDKLNHVLTAKPHDRR